MEDDIVYLTLQCRDCEIDRCIYCPKGTYLKGKEGCTRKVSEDIAAQFNHYNQEVRPFWKQYSLKQVKKSYKEILDFLFKEIYAAPIGQKLDKYGKIPEKRY